MIKKIFFQLIFLSFLFLGEAFASESGGMPQLNPEFWISQIFWLTLTFGTLYVILSKLILPKISANLETRKSQILENIEAAEKHREESEQKIKEYDKIVQDSKIEAKSYFNQVREKILKDINLKKENLDKEFIKILSSKLYEWTGNRWIITLSKKKGKPSIKENEVNLKKDLLEKTKKRPIYKKMLEVFPDAELIDIEIEEKNND